MSRCKGKGQGACFSMGLKERTCSAPLPAACRNMTPEQRSIQGQLRWDTGRADKVLRRFSWQDEGDGE